MEGSSSKRGTWNEVGDARMDAQRGPQNPVRVGACSPRRPTLGVLLAPVSSPSLCVVGGAWGEGARGSMLGGDTSWSSRPGAATGLGGAGGSASGGLARLLVNQHAFSTPPQMVSHTPHEGKIECSYAGLKPSSRAALVHSHTSVWCEF